MSYPPLARGSRVIASFAVPAVLLAAFGVAGCSSQPDTSQASVGSCAQFGMSAIRQHVTVTALPPACQGLTAAQINAAAGTALRSAASGVRDKAQRRQRIVQASHYLAHMFQPVPAAHSEPPVPSPPARWVSRTTLSLLALASWLVTVALGLSLLARRMPRGRARGVSAARLRPPAACLRLPALNRAHLALAAVSLLAWIVYLAVGATGIAWTAVALLPPVAGLGMALVFLPRLPGSAENPPARPPLSADSAPGPADSAQVRRPPVLTIGAHVTFAIATILFAVLASIGTG